MQNVPKIVRERLRAATPAVDHPDADVLTAFAERSLPKREQGVVLEHLARCGDCRDIVALALPATEPVEAVGNRSSSGQLTWPALRWAFVAVGVVAIASLGIVQYQRGRTQNMAASAPARSEIAAKGARDQSSPTAAVSKSEKIPAPPPSAFVDSRVAPVSSFRDKEKELVEKNSTLRADRFQALAPLPPASTGRDAGSRIGQLAHGPRVSNQWQQNTVQNQLQNQAPAASSSPFAKQQAAGDLSANMEVPRASETVEVQSAEMTAQTQSLDSLQVQSVPAAAQQTSKDDYVSARVAKSKAWATPQVTSGSAPAVSASGPAPSGAIGGPVATSSGSIPRWTISSAGRLQRSFDQGNTWQDVDVNANLASVVGTSLEISANAVRASKNKDARQDLKREAASAAFRAVAAAGTDVWAGGSGLYHSLDAGNHWTRIVPASADAMLTGDIVSLEFSDQHGKVATSTAEIWITTDGGQNWQKQ
jgi:hypothetical protein